jgi:hypothetical protein
VGQPSYLVDRSNQDIWLDPRTNWVGPSGEPGKRGPYQCKRCYQFRHIEKGCNATQAELEQDLPPPRPKKGNKSSHCSIFISYVLQLFFPNPLSNRKTKSEDVEASTIVVEPSPIPHSNPGVTTTRMASLSPTSLGVTTRRMATISPGGISRKIIIE